MPAKASELMRAAGKIGCLQVRQKGSHPDGRMTTIPVHPGTEIGGWLFHQILRQMNITEKEFSELR